MNSHEPRVLQIGDVTLTVRPLMYGEAKSLYIKIGPVFQAYGMGEETTGATGPLLLAYMGHLVSEELLNALVKAFGARTTAEFTGPDGQPRTFLLDKDSQLDQVFGGDMGAIHEWLDFCVSGQYASIIKKMQAANVVKEAKRAAADESK